MIKQKSKILGIADAPFRRGDTISKLVSVLVSHDFHIEAINVHEIEVDGSDAEDAMLSLSTSPHGIAAGIIMTHGITFAGFNIIDPARLSERLVRPVISVTRRKPDTEAMLSAIRKHSYSPDKEAILVNTIPIRFEIGDGKFLYGNYHGLTMREAQNIVKKSIMRGNMPEPVRIAHLMGEAIVLGKTKNRI